MAENEQDRAAARHPPAGPREGEPIEPRPPFSDEEKATPPSGEPWPPDVDPVTGAPVPLSREQLEERRNETPEQRQDRERRENDERARRARESREKGHEGDRRVPRPPANPPRGEPREQPSPPRRT